LKEKILVPETHPGIDEKEDPYLKAVENIDHKQGFVNHGGHGKTTAFVL